MITMLYEKTLSRKTLGLLPESKAEDPQEENGSDGVNGHATGVSKPSSRVKKMVDRIRESRLMHVLRLPRREQEVTKHEAKLPASLGKILNLMR